MPTLGVIFPPDLPPEDLQELALAAEEAGLEELWLWEDCFAQGGIASAAAVLGWTQRMRVGVGLFPVPLRNVGLTAMEFSTLARLFPGRFRPGIGHGVLDWMEQVGVRAESPMTLLSEYTVALQQLLAGEQVSVDGQYVNLRDVGLSWPSESPLPLLMGGIGPRTLQLAGELADGLILTERSTLDEVRDAIAHTAPHAREDFSIVTFVDIHDAPSSAEIADLAQSYVKAGATTVALHSVGEGRPPLVTFAQRVAEEIAPLVQ